MSIVYRELNSEELDMINMIDRSEIIRSLYKYTDKDLVEINVHYDLHGFPNDELRNIINNQKILKLEGGKIFGAFEADTLIGVASIENKIRGQKNKYCKMDILYVSSNYRKQGIASALMNECKEAARMFGATKLYISSTESKNTVEFYMKRGAKLVEELDKELYELEPEDIHLEMLI